MEYILYCDESTQKSSLYSDFFGGCIISGKDLPYVTSTLNVKKSELHLYGEVKWTKVTENYLNKYIELISLFFSFIKEGKIKIRIMFNKNSDESNKTGNIKAGVKYLNLYYQFIKNAFGLKYLTGDKPIYLRIYVDRLPIGSKKRIEFKRKLMNLPNTESFSDSPIEIRNGDVAEIHSHNHVLLQCLDIVLGAMYYRLNDLHLAIPEGHEDRGKRTVAKEKLYGNIIGHIHEVMPNFKINETTDEYDSNVSNCYWNHAYRHWRYLPE